MVVKETDQITEKQIIEMKLGQVRQGGVDNVVLSPLLNTTGNKRVRSEEIPQKKIGPCIVSHYSPRNFRKVSHDGNHT